MPAERPRLAGPERGANVLVVVRHLPADEIDALHEVERRLLAAERRLTAALFAFKAAAPPRSFPEAEPQLGPQRLR